MIVFENVFKKYSDDYVLNNINLEINPSEIFVLCGPSGAGKTTLLKAINCLEKIDSGTIFVDDLNVGDPKTNLRELRKKIGFVFQSPGLYMHLNVLNNVCLAPKLVLKTPKIEAEESAMNLLDRMGIKEKASSYPGQLSGGEQQRVAIARALAMKPEIVLLDEPTSALDPEMTSEVLDVISGLAGNGITLIIVTHEMGFARKIGDRIGFIASGEIIQVDEPANFFDNQKNDQVKSFLSKVLSHK